MIKKRRSVVSKDEAEYMNYLAKEGKNIMEIAEIVGRSRNAVRKHVLWEQTVREDVKVEDIREQAFIYLDHAGVSMYRKNAVYEMMKRFKATETVAISVYNQWRTEYIQGNRRRKF